MCVTAGYDNHIQLGQPWVTRSISDSTQKVDTVCSMTISPPFLENIKKNGQEPHTERERAARRRTVLEFFHFIDMSCEASLQSMRRYRVPSRS